VVQQPYHCKLPVMFGMPLLIILHLHGVSGTSTTNICQCPLNWNPVCGTGVVAPKVTFVNECFSKCSCSFAERSTCDVMQGECPLVNQSKACPNLPLNLDISSAYLEWSKNPSTFNLVVDVRTAEEYVGESKNNKIGHIPDAILVESLVDNPSAADMLLPCKNVAMLVVCRTGVRSLAAADILRQKGYPCVFNMDGGTLAWSQAGFPTVKGISNTTSVLASCNQPGQHVWSQSKGQKIGANRMIGLFSGFLVLWKILLLL